MCWRNDKLASQKKWSITTRLTILYTVLTFTLLLLIILGLNWALLSTLNKVEHQFLLDEPRIVHVIIDISYRHEILVGFHFYSICVLIFGTLGAAILGNLITRRGLRSLKHITHTTEKITVNQLDAQIDPTHWPKELTPLVNAYNSMLDRIRQSFDRLSRFSADLAHELRTPITILMGEAELALTHSHTEEEYRQVLTSSLEEYARLSKMIDRLLFIARAEKSQTPLECKTLSVAEELQAICEYHNLLAEEKGITLTHEGNASITVDPALFRRAINNLLFNAIKYTPPKGHITLKTQQHEKSVTITIQDTGIGIEEAHLPHIFDRFYRVDKGRSSQSGGTGLGLAIVKSIMDMHKGSVTLTSQPGCGTTVTLTFPI